MLQVKQGTGFLGASALLDSYFKLPGKIFDRNLSRSRMQISHGFFFFKKLKTDFKERSCIEVGWKAAWGHVLLSQ